MEQGVMVRNHPPRWSGHYELREYLILSLIIIFPFSGTRYAINAVFRSWVIIYVRNSQIYQQNSQAPYSHDFSRGTKHNIRVGSQRVI